MTTSSTLVLAELASALWCGYQCATLVLFTTIFG